MTEARTGQKYKKHLRALSQTWMRRLICQLLDVWLINISQSQLSHLKNGLRVTLCVTKSMHANYL